MDTLFGAVIFLGVGLVNFWWWRATQNVAEMRRGEWRQRYFYSKLLAGREEFTDLGWRYRNRAAAAAVFLAVWMLLGGPLLMAR